jgi:hypothetical protein
MARDLPASAVKRLVLRLDFDAARRAVLKPPAAAGLVVASFTLALADIRHAHPGAAAAERQARADAAPAWSAAVGRRDARCFVPPFVHLPGDRLGLDWKLHGSSPLDRLGIPAC